MDRTYATQLKGFYENELTNYILPFWLSRAVDSSCGGYFNCFDNRGIIRVSTDKYIWSQGRFVWLFSRLADMRADVFTRDQRASFLDLARGGADFLLRHCLIAPDDWRCVFLTDRAGNPKRVDGWDQYDMSIFADCFVVCGLARFALASESEAEYAFAKRLYQSCVERVEENRFHTLPYPLSDRYCAHSIPMILTNVAVELYRAAERLDDATCPALRNDIARFSGETVTRFIDGNDVVHEIINRNGDPLDGLLGQHANPGHTLEDTWFLQEAADLLQDKRLEEGAFRAAKKALDIGWDAEFGGLLHYADLSGGPPRTVFLGKKPEPAERQVAEGWGDKLWWVHAEALYTTLLFALRRNDQSMLDWHQRIFDYTFSQFPNPDSETREWIQILGRDGAPQDKCVALPVKDPYHIARALILLIELLDQYDLETPRERCEAQI